MFSLHDPGPERGRGSAKRPAPPEYLAAAEGCAGSGLQDEGAYEFSGSSTGAGPAPDGLARSRGGVEHGAKMMTELGFDEVHARAGHRHKWVRGDREEAAVVGPSSSGAVPLTDLRPRRERRHAGAGDHGSRRRGPVLRRAQGARAGVKDKIVFFNRPMDRTLTETFAAYGGAADQRVRGASKRPGRRRRRPGPVG